MSIKCRLYEYQELAAIPIDVSKTVMAVVD